MKIKPVFKNVTKGRIQIIQQGIPIWLNPGDTIQGERFRAYIPMGLEEVGRQAKQLNPVAQVVIDDILPKKSPITLRASIDEEAKVVNIELDDVVIPTDTISLGGEELKQSIVADILPLSTEEEEEEEDTDYGAFVIIEDDVDLEDIIIEEPEEPAEEVVDNYPNKCPEEGCDRAFASKRGLKSHSRIHN